MLQQFNAKWLNDVVVMPPASAITEMDELFADIRQAITEAGGDV